MWIQFCTAGRWVSSASWFNYPSFAREIGGIPVKCAFKNIFKQVCMKVVKQKIR